eukprot:jgi/Chrpa1/13711/Chrysochromulina_OHIO_Genome00018378-RA
MSLHVVFSAECNAAMDWQSIGLFHSFHAAGQPGNITRLLACSKEQLRTYAGLDAGPTFVHHNMRFGHPLIDEVGYPSYNKPASVMFFLEQVDVKEEYIALLDADMLIREPLDPIKLGAAPGVVVSAEYSYLVGTDSRNATHDHCFARRFLEPTELPLMARCGGFHIFHREDIRRIAPLWIEFTRQVRAYAKRDPETFFAESFLNWHAADGVTPDMWETRRRQAMWQAEMYGYIFGAARAGVSHVIWDTLVHGTRIEPRGMRIWMRIWMRTCSSVYFNKMNQVHLDLYDIARKNGCEMTLAHTRAVSGTSRPRERLVERLERAVSGFEVEGFFFFGQPPPPRFADGRARTKRDLLCIEHLRVLNDAICEFYKERCGEPSQWRCTGHHGRDLDLQRALRECHDTHSLCPVYATSGECARNPIWMLSECAASCGLCDADNQLNPLTRTMLMRQIEPYELIGANARRPPDVLGLEHLSAEQTESHDGHEEEDGECAREGEALADDS